MDAEFDLSGILGGGDSAIGNAMNALLSRPDLIANIASELGLSGNAPPPEPPKNREEKPPEKPPEKPREVKGKSDRDKLLLALRPYLSRERQGAIDMMVSLSSVGSVFGNIDPNIISSVLGAVRGEKNV